MDRAGDGRGGGTVAGRRGVDCCAVLSRTKRASGGVWRHASGSAQRARRRCRRASAVYVGSGGTHRRGGRKYFTRCGFAGGFAVALRCPTAALLLRRARPLRRVANRDDDNRHDLVLFLILYLIDKPISSGTTLDLVAVLHSVQP